MGFEFEDLRPGVSDAFLFFSRKAVKNKVYKEIPKI